MQPLCGGCYLWVSRLFGARVTPCPLPLTIYTVSDSVRGETLISVIPVTLYVSPGQPPQGGSENPRRSVFPRATTDRTGADGCPHTRSPFLLIPKGRCPNGGCCNPSGTREVPQVVEKPGKKPRERRIGHVGQAYLEALEAQRRRGAEAIRGIRGAK